MKQIQRILRYFCTQTESDINKTFTRVPHIIHLDKLCNVGLVQNRK
jgi:hypothetical protein